LIPFLGFGSCVVRRPKSSEVNDLDSLRFSLCSGLAPEDERVHLVHQGGGVQTN